MNLDLQKLARLKAELQAFVELAEKADLGPWTVTDAAQGPYARIDSITHYGAARDTDRYMGKSTAQFIAQARTMGLMGCKMLLTAIEGLEERLQWDDSAETCINEILNNYEA